MRTHQPPSPPEEPEQPIPWAFYNVRTKHMMKMVYCQDFIVEEGVVIFHGGGRPIYVVNVDLFIDFEPSTQAEVEMHQGTHARPMDATQVQSRHAPPGDAQTAYIPRTPGTPI